MNLSLKKKNMMVVCFFTIVIVSSSFPAMKFTRIFLSLSLSFFPILRLLFLPLLFYLSFLLLVRIIKGKFFVQNVLESEENTC